MNVDKSTDNFLSGTDADNRIRAGAGDDTVFGGAGNDFLNGQSGTDTAVFSGNLSDYTIEKAGGRKITVTGLDGVDTLKNFEFLQFDDVTIDLSTWSFDGNQVFTGTDGKDKIKGGDGDDTITGGAGNDRLNGKDGIDTAVFSGDLENYTIREGKNGQVIVEGPDGRDTLKNIEFLQFDDALVDLSTWDFDAGRALTGTDARERINGTLGDDTVTGGLGDDRLFGNGGIDTAVFAGSIADYTINDNRAGTKVIVNGAEGKDQLSDFEILQFDDFSVDLASWNFEGNNGPLTNASTVVLNEAEDVVTNVATGPQEVGNIGLWYIFDFDTGEITTAVRNNNISKTTQDAADTYLSNGNGLILHPNTNDANWVFWASSFANGVESAIAPTDVQITDLDGGPLHQLHSTWVTFGDENQLVDEIRVEVTGIELADGRVVDVAGTLSNIDYEIAETDDMIVESGAFHMVTNTDAPAVVITADVFDPEGDTLIFTVDASATVGEVINNGDGTFTYDAGDSFEHLNAGETATDSFFYTVDDGNGGLATELVSITINGADEYWV